MENRNTYFYIDLKNIPNDEDSIDKLSTQLDLILSSTQAIQVYKYILGHSIVCLFKVEVRKRRGQIIRLCERYLEIDQNYETEGISQRKAFEYIMDLRKSTGILLEEPTIKTYVGSDLIIFETPSKWHPWQKEVYKMLFDEIGEIIPPDNRSIISLVDKVGNCGKSSFWKYLMFKHPDSIGRITYGTAAQLRSSVLNIGPKPIYICDLSRTKGRTDSEIDLISVIEDIKSGTVISSFYGKGRCLLFDPPHIILSSTHVFTKGSLSEDRWKIFEIKNYKLGKVNKLLKERKRNFSSAH